MSDWNNVSAMAENNIVSELMFDKASLAWTINNFSQIRKMEFGMNSPIFSPSSNHKIKWCVAYESLGCNPLYLKLYLSGQSEEKEVWAKFWFTIFNKDGKSMEMNIRNCGTFRKFEICQDPYWGIGVDQAIAEEIFSNDVLKLHCEVVSFRRSDVLKKICT